MEIKICSADFLNSESQDKKLVLALKTLDIIYLGIDETNGQGPLITATSMLFLAAKITFNGIIV